jgi:DNA replication protein DnaC
MAKTKLDEIQQYAKLLRLGNFSVTCSDFIHKAVIDKPTYQEFIYNILKSELEERQKKELLRRIKAAKLPKTCDLDKFDFNHSAGLTKFQLNQLRELVWLDQMYNLILMGPSGTGKTFITAGLVHDAVLKGYRAIFITMDNLINILRLKDISAKAIVR